MAYVYKPDSSADFSCSYGTVLGTNCTARWTSKVEPTCPDQNILDLDDRLLGGSDAISSFTVDGC